MGGPYRKSFVARSDVRVCVPTRERLSRPKRHKQGRRLLQSGRRVTESPLPHRLQTDARGAAPAPPSWARREARPERPAVGATQRESAPTRARSPATSRLGQGLIRSGLAFDVQDSMHGPSGPEIDISSS